MTPTVDGRRLHFESRGLYDGVSILWDRETETIWNHVTGEAMFGPLEGERLETSHLLHMNVEQALADYPDLEVAISDREIGRPTAWTRFLERIPMLRDRLRGTMGRVDGRRPDMELGLGVWVGDAARYYPLERIVAEEQPVFGELGGERFVVYIDPISRTPAALMTSAQTASWTEAGLRFDDGTVLKHGGLFAADGTPRTTERPMQLFTRWYGFAIMFRDVEVYDGD